MKASELRIGNLVSHPELEISIVCIIQNNCYGVSNKKIDNTRVSYLKCQPIKLTEEWLLKLGFVPNGFSMVKGEFNVEIWLESEIGHTFKWNGFVISISLKYVHQLQNLYFALTGKELIINK